MAVSGGQKAAATRQSSTPHETQAMMKAKKRRGRKGAQVRAPKAMTRYKS